MSPIRGRFLLFPICLRDASMSRVGKFGTVDFFDVNSVGSDSHLQFMNWAVDQNGAYDFAADTRGYTWGGILEYQQRQWGFRFAEALMPSVANGMQEVWNLRQARGENYEFELHHGFLPKQPGTIRLLSYTNHANMGIYRVAINRYLDGLDPKPEITYHPLQTTRKYGFGVNVEQGLTRDLIGVSGALAGTTARQSRGRSRKSTRPFAGGIAMNGRRWRRSGDRAGVAFASDAISGDHRRYLGAWRHGLHHWRRGAQLRPGEDSGELINSAPVEGFLCVSGSTVRYEPGLQPGPRAGCDTDAAISCGVIARNVRFEIRQCR